MQCMTCCQPVSDEAPCCQDCIDRMVMDALDLEQVSLWHMFECPRCSDEYIVSVFIGNGD